MPFDSESAVDSHRSFLHPHTTEIRVRYCEIDGQGRVHNSQYLNYFERGRVEMLRSFGISYRELERSGLMLVVKTMHVEFHSPAEFDENLHLRTSLSHCYGARIDHRYELVRVPHTSPITPPNEPSQPEHSLSSSSPPLVVTGFSSIACVDRSGRVRRLPKELQLFRQPEER